MNKIGFYITLLSGATGFTLFFPRQVLSWNLYSSILTLHIIANFFLIGFIFIILFSHIRKVYRKTKNKVRMWNGIGYFATILLSIITGLTLGYSSPLAIPWILPLHLIVGIWTIIFAIQHVKYKRSSNREIPVTTD